MARYLGEQSYTSELIVVDDGSDDGTSDAVREVAGSLGVPVRLIRYPRNRGKGRALKVGFAASRGDRVAFTDADLSVPIETLQALLEPLERGSDIAIGSRKLEGSRILVHQPWYRERLGEVFRRMVRKLIAEVSDVTCGFKAFRGEVGRDLFSRMRIDDWSFDAELLMVARQRGCRIAEIPVEWEDREGTKVSLLHDILGSLLGLLRIRVNAALGRYAAPVEVEKDLSIEIWTSWADHQRVAPNRAR